MNIMKKVPNNELITCLNGAVLTRKTNTIKKQKQISTFTPVSDFSTILRFFT